MIEDPLVRRDIRRAGAVYWMPSIYQRISPGCHSIAKVWKASAIGLGRSRVLPKPFPPE
jgi:hypothetical protein